jgi:glycosyltransferase involved in cell wall biosynthesis
MQVTQMIYGFSIEGPGGGISRFAIDLSRALDPQKFAVTIAGLWDRGTQAEQERLQQLRSEGLAAFSGATWDEAKPYQSFWRAYQTIRDHLAQEPPALIHSHSEFGDMTALLLKLSLRSPILLRSVHYGYHNEWRKRPLRRLVLTNFLYPLMMRQEIGVSQAITERLNQRRLSRGALCIHNAIDLERFRKAEVDVVGIKQSLGLPPDAPLAGTIGRLTEQKGFKYLVDAIPIVLRKLPQARFLIIGEGELEADLKNQTAQLGVADKVTFTGPRTDIEKLLPCLDLFVSSSLWEGLPTVILESMAAGVAVVATDIPGTRELVEDQVSGWLAPAADASGLGKAILEALKDSQKREQCLKNAEGVVNSFSIRAVAGQHEELYARMLARG